MPGPKHRLVRLSTHHHYAMALRLQGLSYEAIARELGRSPATVRTWFVKEPLFRDHFSVLQQDYFDHVVQHIASAAQRAVERLVQLLDSPNEQVALAAARDLLDRAGVRVPDRHEVTGPRGGPLQLQWSDGQPFDLA